MGICKDKVRGEEEETRCHERDRLERDGYRVKRKRKHAAVKSQIHEQTRAHK